MTMIRTALLAAACLVSAAPFAVDAKAQNGYVNPEIYNSGRVVTDARYCPFTGQIIVRTDQTQVRESYLDPNRNVIDPGSYHRVNRYETDVYGVRWHITGEEWTSNGVPHGNLSRRRVISGGGVVEDRNEHVAFSTQPRQSQPRQFGGGSVEDRNEHVAFGVPGSNTQQPRTRKQPNQGRGISFRNFSPF